MTLREAAGSAYEEALAPIHTTIVRVRNQVGGLAFGCSVGVCGIAGGPLRDCQF